MRLSKLILAAALAAAGLAAAGAGEEPAPPPCSSPEHRQFDFWVGDWVVHRPDGARAGTNRIESILGGCVLSERWEGDGGSRGRSFNMFYEREGLWRQTWVDNSGGRLDLAGGLDGNRMVLAGETPGRDGGRVRHRITWEPLAGGRVRQHWQASDDGGENWRDAFVGVYSRREDAAPAPGPAEPED